MAKHNSKKDTALRILAIVGAVLALAAACGGFWLSLSSGVYYGLEKAERIFLSSEEDILSAGEAIYNDECILTEDIRITDSSLRIGTEQRPFTGVFDGRGRTVYFDFTAAEEGESLFGCIGEGGVVRNTNFVFGSVEVSGSAYAGIAQINYGTFENCTVTFADYRISDETGMFSPAIGINHGTISNVVAECTFTAAEPMQSEACVLFGSICAYNYGRVENTVSCPVYRGFVCTDEFKILTGDAVNAGIAAACAVTASGGRTENNAAVLASGVYTSDKTSLAACSADRAEIFARDMIFDTLDFDNRVWRLSAAGELTLIQGDAEE